MDIQQLNAGAQRGKGAENPDKQRPLHSLLMMIS